MQKQAHGGNLAWAAALAGCSQGAILDFSASINPLGLPKSVIAAIVSQFDNLRNYPDPDYSELRLALSHFHQLSPEWILPGNGSAELLTLVGRELGELTATALITPAFGDYYRAMSAYGAKIWEFPLDLSRLGVQEHGNNQLLLPVNVSPLGNSGLLLNNPHDPTGEILGAGYVYYPI